MIFWRKMNKYVIDIPGDISYKTNSISKTEC